MTVTIVTPAVHGTITGGTCPDLTCEYTPTAGYFGPDSFVYHVSDGTATSSNATVSIAVQGSTKIISAGPLTKIGVTGELNCSVNHTGDSAGEFYADTACATFLAVGPVGGSVLYGPSSVPAGISGEQVWTTISQTPVTGAGTAANPFTIVSVVDAGATGLRVTQTDSYVVGQEAYRTDVTVANNGGVAKHAIIYRAADCYLQDSDSGFGAVNAASGAVACVAADPLNPGLPGSRIEQWFPLSAGSHYLETGFSSVWGAISSKVDFPDTCDCAVHQDNGAGLSWGVDVAAGGSVTKSHFTTFSPLGVTPLTMTKTALPTSVAAGGTTTYTIVVTNHNASPATLTSVSDTLPAGFGYVTGSSRG